MNDNGRDDLDRALGDGLSALAPDAADAEAVLSSLRPQLRRARTRHRVARGSTVIVAVVVMGSVAAVAANQSSNRRVNVAAPSTSSSPPDSRKHASTSTTNASVTTATTPARRGDSATGTTVPPAVVPPATSRGPRSGPPESSTSTSTTAPPAGTHSYSAKGGSVTVRFRNGALTLESYQAAAGYTAEVHSTQPDDVEVRFTNGGQESRIRIRVDHGRIVPEISEH